MNQHWQEAQEAAKKTGWSNFVFDSSGQACIAGSPDRGWIILSPQHHLQLQARTEQGVDLALQELGLPLLGWS